MKNHEIRSIVCQFYKAELKGLQQLSLEIQVKEYDKLATELGSGMLNLEIPALYLSVELTKNFPTIHSRRKVPQ